MSGISSRAWRSSGGIRSSQSVSGNSAWARPHNSSRVSNRWRMGAAARREIRTASTTPATVACVRVAGKAVPIEEGSVLLDQPIDYQQNDGADHRANETGCFAGIVDAQRLTAVGGCKRAADAEQDGHDPAHAVITRFEKARDEADDQADQNGSDNAHWRISLISAAGAEIGRASCR